ncbi:tetratricopeptide repeat protein, partial [Aromatoleum diolicum]|uniref:tetratricopeptide repeat protein n=1 Tax=Aromatoleum diolicum TaxID=75796 RepID=UPI001B7D0E54
LSVLQLAPPSGGPGVALSQLRDSARLSGGLHLTPGRDDSDTRQLTALFAANARTAADSTRSTGEPRELGPWLLPLLLPLVALAFRHGVLLALALPILLLPPPAHAIDLAGWWSRADRRAIQYLQSGDPDRAALHFTDPRWQAVAHYRAKRHAEAAAALAPFTDADSLYNRGNALAHLGRLDEAVQALDAALHLRPDDADIRYNRDLVRELLDRKGTPPPPAADSDAPAADAPPRTPDTHDQTGAPPPASPTAPNASGSAPQSSPTVGTAAQTTPGSPQAANEAPPSTDTSPRGRSDPAREAGLLADQWLRGVPDEPAGLLRRKLLLEHQRRQRGEAPRPWQ